MRSGRRRVVRDVVVRAIVASLLWAFSCPVPSSLAQSFDHELPDLKEEPEALAWLKEKPGAGFEVVSYHGQGAARRFVEKLYREGALYVGVVVLLDAPAALRVYLPGDIRKRGRIFEIFNKELELNGFAAEKDTGQGRLTLWYNA